MHGVVGEEGWCMGWLVRRGGAWGGWWRELVYGGGWCRVWLVQGITCSGADIWCFCNYYDFKWFN